MFGCRVFRSAAVLTVAGFAIHLALGAEPAARAYPNKPIRMVVPFTAGSATDMMARLIGPKMAENWGQQVVVDNRPSAGGAIAGSIVATAAPDGHTILVASAVFAGSAALYDKLPYDPVADFQGVTQLASTPFVLIVAPGRGVKSLKELIALAVTTPQRAAPLPDVPAVAELGLPEAECDGWYGAFVQSKTPRSIVNALSLEIARILELADVQEKIIALGATINHSTPEAFDKMVRAEILLRRKIFGASGAKVE